MVGHDTLNVVIGVRIPAWQLVASKLAKILSELCEPKDI